MSNPVNNQVSGFDAAAAKFIGNTVSSAYRLVTQYPQQSALTVAALGIVTCIKSPKIGLPITFAACVAHYCFSRPGQDTGTGELPRAVGEFQPFAGPGQRLGNAQVQQPDNNARDQQLNVQQNNVFVQDDDQLQAILEASRLDAEEGNLQDDTVEEKHPAAVQVHVDGHQHNVQQNNVYVQDDGQFQAILEASRLDAAENDRKNDTVDEKQYTTSFNAKNSNKSTNNNNNNNNNNNVQSFSRNLVNNNKNHENNIHHAQQPNSMHTPRPNFIERQTEYLNQIRGDKDEIAQLTRDLAYFSHQNESVINEEDALQYGMVMSMVSHRLQELQQAWTGDITLDD